MVDKKRLENIFWKESTQIEVVHYQTKTYLSEEKYSL